MQSEHLIILVGVIIGFALLTFFIDKALRRAHDRGFIDGNTAGTIYSQDRFNVLNADLAALATRRERERKGFLETIEAKNQAIKELKEQLELTAAGTLTQEDIQVLINTATTLDVAHKFWLPIKGTEPWRARAATQLGQLNKIANRILESIRAQHPALQTAPAIQPGEAA